MALVLPRRELLTGVAALSAARAFGICDPAEARLHGGASAPSGLIPPAAASAVGFNNLTFSDDFTSTSTIDLADTQAPGFKWYVHNRWPLAANSDPTTASGLRHFLSTPSSCFSQSGSILTCDGTTGPGNYGVLLTSACVDPGNSANYIGFAATGGYYVEAQIALTVPSGPGSDGFPALFTFSMNSLTGSPSVWNEIDYFEQPNFAGQNNAVWHYLNPGPTPTAYNNTNHGVGPSIVNGVPNIYGFRWTPTAMNVGGAGVGTLFFYFNNVITSSSECAYSFGAPMAPGMNGANPNGMLSELDGQSYPIILGFAKQANSIAIDWVNVWQT